MCIEDHRTWIFHGVSSWSKECISRVAFGIGGRNLDNRGLFVEGDIALRRTKSVEPEIIPAESSLKSKPKELRNHEEEEESNGRYNSHDKSN